MPRFNGSCHCGAIKIIYESATAPEATTVRACQCSFCRKHGMRSISDPNGRIEIKFRKADARLYRFELKTADFIICRQCGVYVGAAMSDGDATVAIANANCMDDHSRFTGSSKPRDYGTESTDERRKRRASAWTPADIRINA